MNEQQLLKAITSIVEDRCAQAEAKVKQFETMLMGTRVDQEELSVKVADSKGLYTDLQPWGGCTIMGHLCHPKVFEAFMRQRARVAELEAAIPMYPCCKHGNPNQSACVECTVQ